MNQLTLSYQQVNGNEYFDFVHESSSNFLANTLYSDFNGPNEKSFKVGYGLDMAGYGIPGLTLSVYTARGWDIDGTHYRGNAYNVNKLDGEHHKEYGAIGGYVVQSGKLKGSSFKAIYFAHRGSENQIDSRINELRLITTIPFELR